MTFAPTRQNHKRAGAKATPEIHIPRYDYLEALDLSTVDPDPDNPRARVTSADVVELRASIEKHGLLSPLVVMHDNPGAAAPRWRVLCGHRRLRALLDLGQTHAPAFGVEHETGKALAGVLALVENGQREALDPILESDRIAALVGRPGWSAVDVAAQLGRSPDYVHERLALSGLSITWRAARLVPEYRTASLPAHVSGLKVAEWPMRWLREVALLDPAQQDELLAEFTRQEWSRPDDLEALREEVRARLGHLGAAPFDLEAEDVAPGCGSCLKCPRHSLASPGLFEDLAQVGDLKKALCRDSVCYGKKVNATAAARVRAAKAKHGDKLIVLTNRIDELDVSDGLEKAPEIEGIRAIEHHQVVPAKKGEKGAVPAVRDYGPASSIQWVRPVGRGSESSDAVARPKVKKKTLADRRKDLEKRRARFVLAKIVEDLERISADHYLTLDDRTTLELVGAFGLSPREFDELETLKLGKGEAVRYVTRLNAAARETTEGSAPWAARNLWINRAVVAGVVDQCSNAGKFSGADVLDVVEDARALYLILKRDAVFGEFTETALVELPEPKSWAAQEAEAATKGKGKAKAKVAAPSARVKAAKAALANAKPKGKAGKRAKGKRAAAADPEADDGEDPRPGPAVPRRYELDRLDYLARLDACPACGQPVVWHRLESGADVSLDVRGRVVVVGAAGRTFLLERHASACRPPRAPF